MYLIGEVSRKVNLSQKRIREYEDEGFISPIRNSSTNNRNYSEFDINQIKQIKKLIHKHGLTVACLKTLLNFAPCWKIFDCNKTEKCPAFKNLHTSCYDLMKNSTCSDCKTCPVFLNRKQKPIKILIKEA